MKPLLFVSWLFGAYLIKLVDSACQRQFSLYIIPVYVQVVWYTEADGTKTALLMAKDPNTYKTDLQTPRIVRQYKPCSSRGQSSNCVLLCSVANAPDATLTIYKGDTAYSVNKYADLNIDLSLCLEVENHDKNNYSCVISNPTINKTTHLDIGRDCRECKDISQTPIPVMEGDSVTLPTNITEVQENDDLAWMSRCSKGLLATIAEIFHKVASVFDCDKLRSRDRLQLDSQTGDLTIKNTSKEDAGDYKLLVNGPKPKCWSFNVSVHSTLPVPVINNNSLQCPSSSDSKCSLVCSAVNVSDVTLSWYKGTSVLSSISVSEYNNSISLCLEVEYQDKNTYSCVINNPIRNQTTHLDNIKELCSVPSNDHHIPKWMYIVVGLLGLVITICCCYCLWKFCKERQKEAAGENASLIQDPAIQLQTNNTLDSEPQRQNPSARTGSKGLSLRSNTSARTGSKGRSLRSNTSTRAVN